jgi:hypothetical protein
VKLVFLKRSSLIFLTSMKCGGRQGSECGAKEKESSEMTDLDALAVQSTLDERATDTSEL